jgi:hypothetical protein
MNNTGGRPKVITKDTVRKLEDAFKVGFSVSEACLASGISRATYYDHRASDEAFSDKMELAKTWMNIRAKHVVTKAIDDGNLNAAKWWLEHRARSEFGANAIDEDTQWAARAEAIEADDGLRQILDSMKANTLLAIDKTSAAAH